ncbi:MAG TPA: cobalamin-binding protein [Clostridiales bacterium]|nr:cobalamin-binding protein [Clostridiales bacterium]
MDALQKELYNAILEGQRDIAKEKVEQALADGMEAGEVLDVMVTAMGEVGRLFEEGEYFVPEMLIAARAMKTGMEILKPKLVDADIQPAGLVVAGTVKGDLHDIGKNLVGMMMEGKGLEVIDLGTDVPAERFITAAIENNASIICCSALLTTTMGEMRSVVDAAIAAGVRDKVTIMVGGAPVNETFAKSIGADIYTADAASAAEAAVEALKK